VRTGETLGATWGEIDLKAKLWTIPAERMKARAEHRLSRLGPKAAILHLPWSIPPEAFAGWLADDLTSRPTRSRLGG
jgi:integrase